MGNVKEIIKSVPNLIILEEKDLEYIKYHLGADRVEKVEKAKYTTLYVRAREGKLIQEESAVMWLNMFFELISYTADYFIESE